MKNYPLSGCCIATVSPSRRYERLMSLLLKHDIVDRLRLEKWAMYSRVGELTECFRGRCRAMAFTAKEFGCSYEKVRQAVYEIDKHKSHLNTMDQTIKIRNDVGGVIIDIEGTIGVSEEWQFDNPESRVATYERFRECVSQIADIRNSHIRVNIRSTGGDVNDAILIYEALRATGAHVTTCCYGYTASAATIVAQAASEGCRLIAPTSLYLVHNSLCSTEGNADELQAEVELLRQTDRRIAEIYASRSGRDVEAIVELMAENGGKGRWLSPKEAIAAGLVDAIDGDVVPQADDASLGKSAKRGMEALLRAIGIEVGEDVAPCQADDINYIPHSVSVDNNVANDVSKQGSVLRMAEQQRSVAATTLKQEDDPVFKAEPMDVRKQAYESDVKSMKMR